MVHLRKTPKGKLLVFVVDEDGSALALTPEAHKKALALGESFRGKNVLLRYDEKSKKWI